MSLAALSKVLAATLHPVLEDEAPIGTVHHWATGDHKKVAPHQWVPTRPGAGDDAKASDQAKHDKPKHGLPPFKPHKHSGQKPLPFKAAAPAAAKGTEDETDESRLPGAEDPWIPKAKDLPESTAAEYSRGGVYKPERAALHTKILEARLNKVAPPPEGKRPVAVLLMGIPASGKSGIRKSLIGDGEDFVVVDPDEIKEDLPEYQKAIDQRARNASSIVHEESSSIASRLKRETVKSGRSIVIDGTGRAVESYEESLRHLKKNGYDVHLLMAHCDTETAVKRAEERGKATGRWLDPSFIRGLNPTVPRNFRRLARQVDNFALYDTNGFPPKALWTKSAGAETVHDESAVEAFRQIGKSSKPDAAKPSAPKQEGFSPVFAAHAHLRFVVENAGQKEPVLSPDEILKRAGKAKAPRLPKGTPFVKDRGITEPTPDDAHFKD